MMTRSRSKKLRRLNSSLDVGSAAPVPDWASLNADLVELIGWRVLAGDLRDYVRFRVVCSHWSASTVRPRGRGILDPRFHPRRWMIPESDPYGLHPGYPDLGGFVRFVNLSTGAVVRVRLPLLDDHVLLDSADGLLLVLHRDGDAPLRLLHPFTGDTVQLPPLTVLVPLNRMRVRLNQLTTAVSVCSRSGTVTAMLALPYLQRVAYATSGDRRWTPSDCWLHYELNPASCNGELYMTEHASGNVRVYRVDRPPAPRTKGAPPRRPPSATKIAECAMDMDGVRLVEFGSEILLIGFLKLSAGGETAVAYRLADVVTTGRFVPVRSIGNYAVLVGLAGERSVCVPVSPDQGSRWLPSVSPNSLVCIRYIIRRVEIRILSSAT